MEEKLAKQSDSETTPLSKWTTESEKLENAKNLLYFKQDVGLKYDKRKLASLEKQSSAQASLFVKKFGREPRLLFLMSVETIGRAKTYKDYLRLHETRTSKILSKRFNINGANVNWGSWRQFAASTDDSSARKEIFDDFLEKSSLLTPIIKSRFDTYAKTLEQYELTPLSSYLELERIDYDRLLTLVDRLGSGLKDSFRASLAKYSEEILRRDPEYYDDFYFFRSRIFRKYEKKFPTKHEPIVRIVKTMKEMGLNASKVKVDRVDRKGKSASAFCAAIKVPTDVRISYRKSNPLEDFSAVFHEFGHGVHGVSIDSDATYWNKYLIANGVSEIFSIFFEGLMHENLYLREELGLDEQVSLDLLSRFRFNELFFATFYSANSTMKLRYWHDSLDMDEANSLYSDLTEQYMGIRYPGKYWQLHHVMPDYFLYSPSYLIAAVRAFELSKSLRSKFGERYWKDKRAGAYVFSLLQVGQAIEFDGFSRLDTSAYIEHLKEN